MLRCGTLVSHQPGSPVRAATGLRLYLIGLLSAGVRAGRSKGWGIVEFETPEEALTAINT